jgi:hypothetical protein
VTSAGSIVVLGLRVNDRFQAFLAGNTIGLVCSGQRPSIPL